MSDFSIDLDTLELDTDVVEVFDGERGRPGRDGRTIEGPPGKPGKPGKDGETVKGDPGASVTLDDILPIIRQMFEDQPKPKDGKPGEPGRDGYSIQGDPGKPGRDGEDGANADLGTVERLIARAVARVASDVQDARTIPVAGDPGEPGKPGDPGANGWTPVPALEKSGANEYLKIIDWIGGSGEKPATGFVTRDGKLSGDKRDAINLRGPKGRDGEDGSGGRGKSAYQSALDNGFVGSEAEWLESLQGADGSGTGSNTIEAIADGTVNGHRAVRATGSDKVALADSSDPAEAGSVIGISLTVAFDGETTTVQVIGEIDEPTFNFTPGPVYFNAIGALTQTVPTSGYVQPVAVALDTTKITVQIGPPIVLN